MDLSRAFYSTTRQLLIVWILMLSFTNDANALMTGSKAWGEINLSGQFLNLNNVEYLLDEQPRYNFNPDKFETNISKAGLGYKINPHLVFWFGYQYSSENLASGTAPENRIWEMLSWDFINQKNFTVNCQSKLEQRFLNGQSQSSERFREKLTFNLPNYILNKYTPVFWNEIFVNITRPVWVNTRVIDQNRAFLGADIPTSKQTYLEVGYLNQYQFEETTANKMNNIMYIGLYIRT